MFEPLLDVVPLVVPLVVLPLLVPFDIVVPVPLSLVPVPFVVPVVLQPNSARVRVSTAMRGRTALCVRFIVILLRFLLGRGAFRFAVVTYFKTQTRLHIVKGVQYVPVEAVVPEVDVVPVVEVPLVDVVLVAVPPLPSALALDVVALFVTGAPVPVSVAVVPVDVGWMVSVEPVVVSAGLRLHAVQRSRMAMMLMTPRMRIGGPPRPCGAIVAPGWRAT